MHSQRAAHSQGFTLLEVLIAMTILSTAAVLMVRLCGDGQLQLAGTAWRDAMTRAGRNHMVELVCALPDNAPVTRLEQWGTLAPAYPEVCWSSSVRPVEGFPVYRMTVHITDDAAGRELVLERFFANPEALEP